MSVELTRWPNKEPPTRDGLEQIFRSEGLTTSWWSSDCGDVYAPHSRSYHKVAFCASGGIVFRIEPSGPELALAPGDRLDIPADTSHSAVVGGDGATCVEALRQSARTARP